MEDYKYLAIVKWAKEYIISKHLLPNDRFLSEKELCEIHGVSRQTVRQALNCLENENVISRQRGSGTFVKDGVVKTPAQDMRIGVISTYFSDYIFPQIVTGIESVLNDANIGMQLTITHNQVYEEAKALKSLIATGVQGLIVEPSKSALPNPNTELYQEIRSNRIPLVFFNAKYPWSDYPYVSMDDEAAGKIVTDYLFECGHKRIFGMFALDDIQGHKRYGGFMKSCIEHNISTAEKDVIWFATAERNAIFLYAQLKILEMLHQSTAVVCYNDKLAINLLRFCRQQGIRVPEDVSIVGIDDSKYSSICEVPLTTVRHPHQVLGETAAKMLIEQMNSNMGKQEDSIFVPDLVVRDSVRILNEPEKRVKEAGFFGGMNHGADR